MFKLPKITLQLVCIYFSLYLRSNIQMKIFAYILAVVVLTLAIHPCADGTNVTALQKTELSQNTDNSNHQNDFDNCSPFCTCQCCQSNFFVSGITVSFPAVEIEIRYVDPFQIFNSIELFDFLIPPKY